VARKQKGEAGGRGEGPEGVHISVADPDHFDADPDPDPTSEKNRIRPLKKTGSGSDHALYKIL
jgi:hypothetical protein